MIEHVHLQYAMTAPERGTNSYSHLFELLDKLDPVARDALLMDLYLGYDVPEQKGSRERVRVKRYASFKKIFRSANATCKDEAIVVFGLVSYILAEANRKSDVARFERIMDGHRSFITSIRREMVKEEMPANKAWQELKEILVKIESLHGEVEESRRSYRVFCEKVVKPLLRQPQ